MDASAPLEDTGRVFGRRATGVSVLLTSGIAFLGVLVPSPASATTGTVHLHITDEATGEAPAAGYNVTIAANGATVADLDEPAGTTTVDQSISWPTAGSASVGATVTPVQDYDENGASPGNLSPGGDLDLYIALTPWPQFTATHKPKVTGRARVGSTLSASVPAWDPAATFTYQWLRNGKPIAHATTTSYHVAGADYGHLLSVAVTGSAAHTWTTRVTSAATSHVRSLATVHVGATSPARHHVRLAIRVSAPGTIPHGQVSVKRNGTVVRKASLTAGKVVVKLGQVHSGRQKYTVVYPTTGLVDGATGHVTVRVL